MCQAFEINFQLLAIATCVLLLFLNLASDMKSHQPNSHEMFTKSFWYHYLPLFSWVLVFCSSCSGLEYMYDIWTSKNRFFFLSSFCHFFFTCFHSLHSFQYKTCAKILPGSMIQIRHCKVFQFEKVFIGTCW